VKKRPAGSSISRGNSISCEPSMWAGKPHGAPLSCSAPRRFRPRRFPRFRIRSEVRPLLNRATDTARAAPPAPIRTALFPLGWNSISCSTEPMNPGASVLYPLMRPSVMVTVLTAPMISASGSSSSTRFNIACLCGMVKFRPSNPRATVPRTAVSKFSGVTS